MERDVLRHISFSSFEDKIYREMAEMGLFYECMLKVKC